MEPKPRNVEKEIVQQQLARIEELTRQVARQQDALREIILTTCAIDRRMRGAVQSWNLYNALDNITDNCNSGLFGGEVKAWEPSEAKS